MTATNEATRRALRETIRAARPPRCRTMREFAEQEIWIPNGPYEKMRFDASRQPYSAAFLDQVDSQQYGRFLAAGPSQSGKTTTCAVIPIVYTLFELCENVLFGVPSRDMVKDKWTKDILPIIEKTRYAELLPRTGAGSRGGSEDVTEFTFGNGCSLRFMTSGGSDQSRAAYTCRTLVITELQGFDVIGSNSQESTKLKQLEARTNAFGDAARIYLECTVTTEQGATWREYGRGTESRLLLPCPHCGEYVLPGREHLVGWQDAETDEEARERARLICPICQEPWEEDQWREANSKSVLVHGGQTVRPDGTVEGERKRTRTFSLWWSMPNNAFTRPATCAAAEWASQFEPDPKAAERNMSQFWWAIPYSPSFAVENFLTADAIAKRTGSTKRLERPAGTQAMTVGVDLRKRQLHYVLIAWRANACGTIIDHGIEQVDSHNLGVEMAIREALGRLAKKPWPGEVEFTWVDCGYYQDVVCDFVQAQGNSWAAAKGMGHGQQNTPTYTQPKSTGANVVKIGHHWHVSRMRKEHRLLEITFVDSNHWKSWAHERLDVPQGTAGSIELFDAPPDVHIEFGRQVTAEQQVEKLISPSVGKALVWEAVRSDNHFFDAYYLACAAGSRAGIMLPGQAPPPPPPPTEWFRHTKRVKR